MSATDEGFSNQQKTEPVPPTPPHDVPDSSDTPSRRPADAGSATAPGPRGTDLSDQGASGNVAPTGALPGERENEPDLDAGTTQAPHDAGRPEPHGVGGAHRAPGASTGTPEPIDTDLAEAARRTREAVASGSTEAPAEMTQRAAPAYLAAAGTSETAEPVDGVRIPAAVQPGKPDGEVDTRSRATPAAQGAAAPTDDRRPMR